MSAPLHYVIEPTNPGAHLFRVTLTVAEPDPHGQIVRMPAWIPGSYLVRDFARNVVSATAANADGQALALEKTDKSSWRVEAASGPVSVTIEVYAYDLSVRGAHLDTRHAYFNGPCVFLAAVGQEDRPCDVDIRPPADGIGKTWRVATAMRPLGAERYGYGTYQAENYWELIDHPVEIGELVIGEFEVDGIPHALAVRGHDAVDIGRLTRDVTLACRQHHALFGAPKSLDRYLFLLTVVDKGYGGLEHRWSSSNLCSRDDLPQPGDTGVTKEYRKLLGLLSHEYFHLWNVTRMKPAAFDPYNLSAEMYTGLLWVFEGITSYYDDLGLKLSGLITRDSYFELLGQTITRVLRSAGRHRQSVEASSFEAWTKFYKQDAGSPNFIVSYYQKGSLVALALDLTLRQETNDRVSLDDVVRECWQRFGETGQGMPERGLEQVATEISGVELGEFFERYVRGTDELPLESLLLDSGVRMGLRAAVSGSDLGGTSQVSKGAELPWLGSRLSTVNGQCVFGPVAAGSPAERAGLAPGDEAVALNGLKLTAANIDSRLRAFKPGDTVTLLAFRRDELLRLSVELAEAPLDTCWLSVVDDAEATVTSRRNAWLGD